MSDKAIIADNQQGSPEIIILKDPSETTRRAPFVENQIKAYFLGALHDATFSSSKRFRISQKGSEWLKILRKLLKRIGYNSWIYKEGKNRDIYVLETLANFLDFKFNPLKLKTKGERICYIRGFFDAEGGIPKSKDARFYIQLVQKDKDKIQKLKEMLKELGIMSGKIHNPSQRVDPYYWRIFILAKSQRNFVETINSWHPRKTKTLNERFSKKG